MEEHQTHQMGALIAKLRKERNMTQKELAAKLGVTDKAVSKWERSLSYPDVTLLLPLADALGITASELLNGERQSTPEGERAVRSALSYSRQNLLERVRQAKRVVLAILSLACLLSAGICFVCDYCVTGGFSWSWIVLLSLIFAWAVAAWMLHEPIGAALVDGGMNTLSTVLVAVVCFLWDALAARRERV